MTRLRLLILLLALAAFLPSCRRAACPAYDSYSTNEGSSRPAKQKKKKQKAQSSLWGKRGPEK